LKVQKPREQFPSDLAETVYRALNPRQRIPGFTSSRGESVNPIAMPPLFIDRCRRAYLSCIADQLEGARVLGVTSSLRGEGKTSLAIGVATAISADTQRPTLLLECDLERPAFHRYFGFELKAGLVDWMEGTAPLRILCGGPLVNLFVIPSGAPRDDPSRLFYQLSEEGIVDQLRPHFGAVIIDLPPMLSIAYSSLASRLSDRILLVARYGMTSVDDIEKAIFLLGRERIGGIVLNGTEYRTPEVLRRRL
jgi:Mrp family chromosome partitioning ATPase